jgi:hypothetical protein
MKKITTLFFLFAILSLFTKKIDTKPVFNELTSNNNIHEEICKLKISELSDQNLLEKVKDMDIVSVVPVINGIYDHLFIEIREYIFTNDNKEKNITEFTKKYKEILENNGIKTELSKIITNGIKIDSVKIRCDQSIKDKLKELKILYEITH